MMSKIDPVVTRLYHAILSPKGIKCQLDIMKTRIVATWFKINSKHLFQWNNRNFKNLYDIVLYGILFKINQHWATDKFVAINIRLVTNQLCICITINTEHQKPLRQYTHMLWSLSRSHEKISYRKSAILILCELNPQVASQRANNVERFPCPDVIIFTRGARVTHLCVSEIGHHLFR